MMTWQLQPIEDYHLRDFNSYKESIEATGNALRFDLYDGEWWYWDTGHYSFDTAPSLEPIAGQVYRINGKQQQVFKVTRVESVGFGKFVQVEWDWRGDK